MRVPVHVLECAFINPACALHPAGYQLWWEVSGAESSREERSLSNSTLQYQLTGLTSTTAYALRVAALTAAGRGVVTPSTISTGVPPGTINTRRGEPLTADGKESFVLRSKYD